MINCSLTDIMDTCSRVDFLLNKSIMNELGATNVLFDFTKTTGDKILKLKKSIADAQIDIQMYSKIMGICYQVGFTLIAWKMGGAKGLGDVMQNTMLCGVQLVNGVILILIGEVTKMLGSLLKMSKMGESVVQLSENYIRLFSGQEKEALTVSREQNEVINRLVYAFYGSLR